MRENSSNYNYVTPLPNFEFSNDDNGQVLETLHKHRIVGLEFMDKVKFKPSNQFLLNLVVNPVDVQDTDCRFFELIYEHTTIDIDRSFLLDKLQKIDLRTLDTPVMIFTLNRLVDLCADVLPTQQLHFTF